MEGTSHLSTSGRRRLAFIGAVAVAVGSIGGVGLGARAQSTPDPVPLDVLSVDDRGVPTGEASAAPALSDDGGVVAFESGPAEGDPRVWLRDRVGGSLDPVAELRSRAPGISGNGCLVAYLVPTDAVGLTPATVGLVVLDRCAADADMPLPVGTLIDTVDGEPTQLAAPALSFDGDTIAWSTGEEIRRYVRSSGEFQRTHEFDTEVDATPDGVTGAELDMSADGSTVAYVAGPGLEAFAPTPRNVYVWHQADPVETPSLEIASRGPDGLPGASDSSSPSVSADGSVIVFGSSSPDLVALASAPAAAPFVIAFDRVARTQQVVIEDAVRPVVSSDAEHIAYERAGGLRVVSVPSGSAAGDDRPIDELAAADPTGPAAISAHGRWLVLASASLPGPPATTSAVWAADLLVSDDTVVDTTTTTTTAAPPPPPTEPTVPPTTEPGGADSTPFPPVGFPSVPVFSPRPSFPTSGSFGVGSSGGSSADAPSSSSIATSTRSLVFDPTIIGTGRRVASVELTNASTQSIAITSITIEPAGPFQIIADRCTPTISPGARCAVDLQFAPTEIGSAVASLVVQLSDGSFVTTGLFGDGTPQPTLDVVPAVAGKGQTVTVFGVGFPAGSSIGLEREGVPGLDGVVVSSDGTFAHVIVVLPNTPTGPMELTVLGQPDSFDDVVAEMLVSTRGADSGDVAVRAGVLGGR